MTDKIEGVDDPEFKADEAEAILTEFDGQGKATPDGSKEEVTPQSDFNKLWDDHMKGEPAEPQAPDPEAIAEGGDEIIDETDILKRHELDFENVDDLAEDYKATKQRINDFAELLKKAGVEVSDNPIQDVVDMMEANMMQQQPGILGGGGQKPPSDMAPQAPAPAQPSAPPPQTPPQNGGFQNTENFMRFYPQLKWNHAFLRDLAGAMTEHLPKQEAPKTGDFVTREEAEALVNLNKRLFRDQIINEHTLEKMATGEKLPRNFRRKLAAEVDKNPTPLERAWRGYWLRGRHDGVMSEYAKHLLAERDPSTGLSGAEAEAQAEEMKRAVGEKKALKGGTPPTGGGKKRKVTERDLEAQIVAMQKDLI